MERQLTATELLNGLEYCAQRLEDDEYCEIVCVGGSAMILFYGYPEATSDLDGLDLNNTYYRLDEHLRHLIAEYDQTLPLTDKKEFWFNDGFLDIIGVDHADYIEHINSELSFEFFNDAGYCTIRLTPITLAAIMKNKICCTNQKMRNKDIIHLTWIINELELYTVEDFISMLVEEFPYIEDEWDWGIWERRIHELYSEEYDISDSSRVL